MKDELKVHHIASTNPSIDGGEMPCLLILLLSVKEGCICSFPSVEFMRVDVKKYMYIDNMKISQKKKFSLRI